MQYSTGTGCAVFKESARQENMKPQNGDFVCETCNQAFAYKNNYDEHCLMHDVEQISGTGGTTSKQNDLSPEKRHLKVHACDQCDKSYHRKDHLTRHKLEHTGQRPHICLVCLKSFVRKDKLTRHEKIHYKDNRFSCPDCDKMFLRKDSLGKHRKTHGEQSLPEYPRKKTACTSCTCMAKATLQVSESKDTSESNLDKMKTGSSVNSESSVNSGSGLNSIRGVHSSSDMNSGNSVNSENSVNSGHSMQNESGLNRGTGVKSERDVHNESGLNSKTGLNYERGVHSETGVNSRTGMHNGNAASVNSATELGTVDKSGTAEYKSTAIHSTSGGQVEKVAAPQRRGYWFEPHWSHNHPPLFTPNTGFSQEVDLRVNYQCKNNCAIPGKNLGE